MSCRCHFPRPTRVSTVLLSWFLFVLLGVALNVQLAAQPSQEYWSPLGYDRANEITLNGTIQEVVANAGPGSPAGLHLFVAVTQGRVDVHLGPYLSEKTQEALQPGTAVQIIGAMETVHGRNYLLARQMIFSGRLVTLRCANGLPLLLGAPRAARPDLHQKSQERSNGGAE